jgi:membrane glycosyltransferase
MVKRGKINISMDKKKEKKEKIEDMPTQKTEKVAGEIKKEEKKKEKKEEKVQAKEILGEVNIVPEVIATIISRTVISIPGVAGLATRAKGGIGTLLGTKELEKGINVDP